jgi:hypothetical protein
MAHRALGDVETTMNLVSLPGIHGARAFQHYVLHKKVWRNDLMSDVVLMPDPAFMELVIP